MTQNKAAVEKLKQDIAQVRNELQGNATSDGTTAGDDMEDGSVFVGLAPDGRLIYAMPVDLGFTATFNDAAVVVGKLNEKKVLGHDDWQIPDLDTLKILHKNQNEGSLKGTFNTDFSAQDSYDSPRCYMSSTETETSCAVVDVKFPEGTQGVVYKGGNTLSCRLVRVVNPAP